MPSAYTTPVPTPAALPAHLRVHVLVMRDDGRDLTDEDIAAARAAYPIPAGADPDVGVVGKTKPRKSSPKRAAAKRP